MWIGAAPRIPEAPSPSGVSISMCPACSLSAPGWLVQPRAGQLGLGQGGGGSGAASVSSPCRASVMLWPAQHPHYFSLSLFFSFFPLALSLLFSAWFLYY